MSETNSADNSVIRDLASEMLAEKRTSRKWNTFFRCLLYFYLGLLLITFLVSVFGKGGQSSVTGEHLALIPFNGVIAAGGDVTALQMNDLLTSAFENDSAEGVVLLINSPGGSPVQSESIYQKILSLRAEYPEKKIYSVVSDVCASGSYYVAAATDEIYASRASIVGSIGVRMDSYGFTELMEKVGVESRTITAGENKAIFSPFEEVNPAHVAHLETLIGQVHNQFIDDVKAGRGDRLKDVDGVFSGLFWTGEEAVEIGLVDGIGDAEFIASEKFDDLELVSYEPVKSFMEELSEGMGVSLGNVLVKLFSSANTPVLN